MPLDDVLDCGRDIEPFRIGEPRSESDGEAPRDLVLEDFLPLDDREAKREESSSIVDIVVAAVAVEFER